jgi:hypothetical protein
MPLWAKVDVEMPSDAKLFGQPIVTRWLWLCLITLSKQQDESGAIRGYDCALLASRYNLPRKGVASALTHYQAVRMVELDPDGTIRLLNFTRWQGELTVAEQREQWRNRQDKRRGVTRDSPVTAPVVTLNGHASRVEVEKEKRRRSKATAKDTQGAEAPAPTSAVWQAYSAAIERRYGVAPSDGAPARGKIMQFLRSVPKEEAPLIAEHYVNHNGALYVNSKHPLELLVRDYQKFRTEWINGQTVTATDARSLERTDSNLRGWEKHLVPEGKA